MRVMVRPILCAFLLCLLLPSSGTAEQQDNFAKHSRNLFRALSGNDDKRVELAIKEVAKDDSPRAVKALIKGLRTPNPSHYWMIIAGLSTLPSAKAVSTILEEIRSTKTPPLRRDLVMSLRLDSNNASNRALLEILQNESHDLKVSALDELVDRGNLDAISIIARAAAKDPRDDYELNRRFLKAIRATTKQVPPVSYSDWPQWWDEAKETLGKTSEPNRTQPNNVEKQQKQPDTGVGKTVVETIRTTRITDFLDLKRLKKEQILVIQGANDAVEEILAQLEIPHTVVDSESLRTADLAEVTALFINCGSIGWPTKTIRKLRSYVEKGGYLLATDVAIVDVVNRAFPGYIRTGRASFPDLTVEILPWIGSSGHPYLRGVEIPLSRDAGLDGQGRLTWAIDAGGPSIDFDKAMVIPLIEAPSLRQRKAPSAVAVMFRYGVNPKEYSRSILAGGVYEELAHVKGGSVLCAISHFAKQRSGEDGFALQNLLINFLIEARDHQLLDQKK